MTCFITAAIAVIQTHTQTNTFQVVLGDDNESSFVLFLYKDGGIQWTTGNGGTKLNAGIAVC